MHTNNNISPFFELQQAGTLTLIPNPNPRQGCPLSPLVFAVAIEPLAIALRASVDIRGIQRGTLEHKVSLYADDMLLYVFDPSSSIPNLLELLDEFCQLSGYKVNFQKCELMPIGTMTSDGFLSSTPFKVSPTKV